MREQDSLHVEEHARRAEHISTLSEYMTASLINPSVNNEILQREFRVLRPTKVNEYLHKIRESELNELLPSSEDYEPIRYQPNMMLQMVERWVAHPRSGKIELLLYFGLAGDPRNTVRFEIHPNSVKPSLKCYSYNQGVMEDGYDGENEKLVIPTVAQLASFAQIITAPDWRHMKFKDESNG